MNAFFVYFLVLLAWRGGDSSALAGTELFLHLRGAGLCSVQLSDQTLTLSTGRYRFFDLPSGQQRLTIQRGGQILYSTWVDLKPNTRTLAEYGARGSLRILAVVPHEPSPYGGEPDWYQDATDRSSRWRTRPTGATGSSTSLSLEAVEQLRQALQKEPFDQKRTELVRVALLERNLSARQLGTLLKVFTFDQQRLEAAKLGYYRVVDLPNYYLVFDSFTFPTSVNELKTFLATQ